MHTMKKGFRKNAQRVRMARTGKEDEWTYCNESGGAIIGCVRCRL